MAPFITRDQHPISYTALLGEAVLRQPIGGTGVLLDQLRLVLKMARLDNVQIRIVPAHAGFTPALAGPFVLLEFAKADPVVHLEHHRSSVFLRDKDDVDAYLRAREDLSEAAMSPDESAGLIADVITEQETT